MLNYFPRYFTSNAINLYLLVLVVTNVLFFSHFLSLIWWFFGIIEVLAFFYYSNILTRRWSNISPRAFSKRIFQTALVIRVIWVVFSYWFYTYMTGAPFEFNSADSQTYQYNATWISQLLSEGSLQPYFDEMKGQYSDMGYAMYLGTQYYITGNSIFIARIIKALLGAYMCVLTYRLATRNFGEEVGRMAGIFVMLMPNLIMYTGLQLKETEMVFLAVLFMERADYILRNKKYNFMSIAFPLLILIGLFFMRTVLGITALLAMFTALIFSTSKVLGMGKRTLLIIWIGIAGLLLVGGKISMEIEQVWEARNSNQSTSMEMRAQAEGGNAFAKKMSGAIFAPMILVIPFPTIVETPNQQNQRLINGGNYVKNIMAFFVIFAFYWIIKNGKWRDYTLIGSFIIVYLFILALSAFAQSERFHIPVLPFQLIFAAFGISLMTNQSKRYFSYWMILIFFVIVAWSWFKLAGRGLV